MLLNSTKFSYSKGGGGIIIKKFNWKCNNSNLTECDNDNELRHLKVNST